MSGRTSEAWDGTYRRIDVHTHALHHGQWGGYRGSPSLYVRRLRRAGIDAICLLEPGEVCRKALDKFGADFIIPVVMYRLRTLPADDLRRDMEYWLDHGCRGVKFIAPLYPYCDERYWPLYQAAADRGVVAMFHTGYLGFRGEAEIPPTEMDDMRPAHIDAVARRFPLLKIIMSHFGNPWWEEAWKVSWSRTNVYADLSGGTASRRSMDMWAETFAPDGVLMEDSLGKVLFGTDGPFLHAGEHRFADKIDFHERLFERVAAPEPLRRLVRAGTAVKLFGIKGKAPV